MARTEHIHRLLNIISILQSGRFINTGELAQECQVSRRTVFRDIEKLRQSGLRIAFDEKKQGYQFEDSQFLLPADLTTEEVLALITLCQDLADKKTGLHYLEPARTAAFKLASVLPRKIRKYIGDVIDFRHIRIGPQANLEGTDKLFGQISRAMESHHSLQIQYGSFMEEGVLSTQLNPYCFFFSRRSWYVIGFSHLHSEVRTFHMKRFHQIEVLLETTYEIPNRFSLDSYLGNAWHMIREKDHPYHVVIRFAPLVARNVAEVQWHKTQRLEFLEDGSLCFHVDVEGLNEILWWILGYGKQAEVLEPPELRKLILEHATALIDQYRET